MGKALRAMKVTLKATFTSSGTAWHPKAVQRVEIPKGDGKTRPLGIPIFCE
jgi:retron-type reverse transcriptase